MAPRILSWIALCLIGVACSATNANADVRVAVSRDGVNLFARQSTIREILEEWTRVAGTTFIGLEDLPSELITLDLRGVPEREALEILLRWASGYIIMPAPAGASIQSQFGSVRILATSTARAAGSAPRPLATALVERAEPENLDVSVAPGSDDVGVTGHADAAPAGATPLSRPGVASGGLGAQNRQEEPVGVFGLPPGVVPGEPIGDPFSRPGMIPAWLQGSGVTGSATPGTIAAPQIRTPGPSGSLSPPSPAPPAPVTVTEPSN